MVLRTRELVTTVKPADFAQRGFGEGARGLRSCASKRLVGLTQHGAARAQVSFAQAQGALGRLPRHGLPQKSSMCAVLASVPVPGTLVRKAA